MPEASWPPFQIEYHNRTLSFSQVCAELGSGIIVVPLVAVLANVAIAKAFSKWISNVGFSDSEPFKYLRFNDTFKIILLVPIIATGLAVDASQEMITLGLCNIVGSCFKSMPTCGAFTRSAVSHTSGVKVPIK